MVRFFRYGWISNGPRLIPLKVIYFNIGSLVKKKGHSEYSLYRVQPMNDERAIIFDEAAAEV